MQNEAVKQVIQHAIDDIDSYKGQDIDAADLHHHLYNEDYFIIGYYRAEKFLEKYGIFSAIEEIKQYENDNFGQVTTDFSSSEKVANMFAYIKGEEALNESKALQKVYERQDTTLKDSDLDAIKKDLEEQLK